MARAPRGETVGVGTPLAEALIACPALATLLAFRQIPTSACCTGIVDGTLGEHLARFGVKEIDEFVAWLNEFIRSGDHPARFLQRWRAERKRQGREEKAQTPTFFLDCGCDPGH